MSGERAGAGADTSTVPWKLERAPEDRPMAEDEILIWNRFFRVLCETTGARIVHGVGRINGIARGDALEIEVRALGVIVRAFETERRRRASLKTAVEVTPGTIQIHTAELERLLRAATLAERERCAAIAREAITHAGTVSEIEGGP